MTNEKINFAVQTSKDERDHAMEVLAKMAGSNNAEKLKTLISMVEDTLQHDGLSENFGHYVKSIEQSVDNIKANVIAIVKAAAEEREHDAVELQEKVDTHVKTIKAMQHDREELENRLKTAEGAKAQAETVAEKTGAYAKQLAEEKAFYESATRDKESLVVLLQEKVANLQAQLDAAEDKIVELNTMLAKPMPEQTLSPADYEHISEGGKPPA